MPDAEQVEQEIFYRPTMDRANNVTRNRRWVYDPTEFEGAPDVLAEAERKSWPSHLGIAALALVAAASLLAPLATGGIATGLALAGIFFGWSLFAFANYIAYRLGERVWLQPDTAGRIAVAAFFLTLTSLVAAFVN